MGKLSEVGDAVKAATTDAERDAVLREYGRVAIEYFLTDVETDLVQVRRAVDGSDVGGVVMAWVTAILYKERE